MTQENAWTKKAKRLAPWLAVIGVAVLVGFLVGRSNSVEPEPVSDEAHEHDGAASGEGDGQAAAVWTCAMHPQIQMSEPGQCPICGMDLIPVSPESTDAAATSASEVTLTERARVLAGIRTVRVQRRAPTGSQTRLLGRVESDETTLRTVTTWIGGRIDRLHLRVTGERVRRGQTIASLYSPEVYAAHQDLLAAQRQVVRLAQSTPDTRAAAEAALASTRERLRLLGVPASGLAAMEAATRPQRQVSIRSPFAGTIISRVATEGTYVQAGEALYQVADLSQLWIQLDAYERDLATLSLGQQVDISVEGVPDRAFEGTIAFIEPMVDARRRVARVRVEVDNASGLLRPGMFAEATVNVASADGDARQVMLPDSAPLFTGRRSIVYVEREGDGSIVYEAREVRLGAKLGDAYPVIAGLADGERVVVHGAFAIDADLQIRAGASMMARADDTEPGQYDDVVVVPGAFRDGLATIVHEYLAMHRALAADDVQLAADAARAMVAASAAFQPTSPAAAVSQWAALRAHIDRHAGAAAESTDAADVRMQFSMLSEAMERTLRVFGNSTDSPLRVMHCPMASSGAGANWLQTGESIENPYFGQQMPTCGEALHVVDVGQYLSTPPVVETSAPAGGHQH